MWLIRVLLGSAVICYSQAKFGDLVVRTESGEVSGWERLSRDGRVYQAWTGIPYAEPPVGALRFKVPKPKSSWKGILNATGDAPVCLQAGQFSSPIAGSEDCLYLNVYRPKINKENMPVIVHVHGGAFMGGDMGPRENADYLMDEDVILVALQYRLNALGFMSLGDSVMPGNFGLKDQVLALKWVKRNIAAFGGNPNSVTVIGESAGGASTHILLKSPATDGLVHRAVSDSGTINRFWSMLKPGSTKQHTLLVAKKSGCQSEISQEVLECLQHVNASVILANTMASVIEPSLLLFLPVIEPEDAEDPIATFDLSLRPSNKPWITSVSTGEWVLFKAALGNRKYPSDMRKYLEEYLSSLPIELTDAQKHGAAEILEKFYFPTVNSSVNVVNQVAKMEADMSFIYPVMYNIAQHKGPKWIYRYEYVSEFSREILIALNITEEVAFHSSQYDSYLRLKSLVIPNTLVVETPEDYQVSKRIIKYIVNFAYYDDPTPGPTPQKWKQYKDTEILRVTKLGDYYADQSTLQQLNDVYDLWDTIIGWKDRI